MSSSKSPVPSTKVTSSTPTPSEKEDEESYFPPTTRSATKRVTRSSGSGDSPGSDPDARSRTLSRSPTRASTSSRQQQQQKQRRRKSGAVVAPMSPTSSAASAASSSGVVKKSQPIKSNGYTPNGHLSPSSALSPGSSIYRDGVSRSPSPLGLIPLHIQWRSFIHRHEIPRKALHVSIGFVTLRLYSLGIQPPAIHPWLLGALVPIGTVDFLRHRWPAMNGLYVKLLGALMRESEVNERYNGVIWYLLGTWVAMRFMPKDVGVMSILLLSWCDTAASTVGRRWGKYTPRIRKGKSLAGTVAACAVGITTAVVWWGWVAPSYWGTEDSFQFKGYLEAPRIPGLVGEGQQAPRATGWLALGVMSLWSGIVASVSEAVDVFGWDDNLTIPVLSGLGLWGFLKVFG